MSAVRIALTAVLAAALLGVVLPAVDVGRADRTGTELDAAAERIDRAAAHLRATADPTAPDVPGARAVVAVEVPEKSWHTAGVAYVAVGGPPGSDGNRSVLVYRLDGETRRTVPLGSRLRTADGPVVLRETGTHRVTLTLVRDSGVAVAVSRGGG